MTTSLITKDFRLYNASQFYKQITNYEDDILYMFLGGISSWDDENSPPDVFDNIETSDINTWRKIIGLKRFTAGDACFSAPRYNWSSGIIWTQYDSSNSFYDAGQFYCVTDNFSVYICLDNNTGAVSSIKPTGTSPTAIKTSDGYIWKYLFSVNTSDAIKFLSYNYIPVRLLTSDDGSPQWEVQTSAVPGEIIRVDILNGGTGFMQNSGTAVSATSNTITLNSAASGVNNIYQGYNIYILTGNGQGELKTITSYNSSTKIATISPAWTNVPTNSSTYIVSPPIVLTGDGDGLFKAYTEVSNGAISKVNILSRGSGYTSATASSILGGSGVVYKIIYSPKNGIGANPVRDIFAHNITINSQFQSSESGYIMTNNDFRVVGILSNPLLNGSNSKADALLYDNTNKLTISSTGSFVSDEIIVGNTSGAKGRLVKYNSSNIIVLTEITGAFQVGENITGSTSNNVGYISNKTDPLLKQFSGDILYIKNQEPVRRSTSQTEDFKITIKF